MDKVLCQKINKSYQLLNIIIFVLSFNKDDFGYGKSLIIYTTNVCTSMLVVVWLVDGGWGYRLRPRFCRGRMANFSEYCCCCHVITCFSRVLYLLSARFVLKCYSPKVMWFVFRKNYVMERQKRMITLDQIIDTRFLLFLHAI